MDHVLHLRSTRDSVAIVRIHGQPALSAGLRIINGLKDFRLEERIGLEFLLFDDAFVIGEKLAFKNAQPVELGKQKCAGA